MKRLFAVMMAAMMVCGLFVVSASADNNDLEVISPEVVSPEVISPEVVSPEVISPEVDSPETDDPENMGGPDQEDGPNAGMPSSPQTGYPVGIVGLAAAAAASGAVAVITGKKANKR